MTYPEFISMCSDILKRRTECKDEENTKIKLIIPFLEFLGYGMDDIRFEKPEANGRLDIEVSVGGKPRISIEAKKSSARLTEAHRRQLESYMKSSENPAPLGILTNGVDYWFHFRSGGRKMNQPTIVVEKFHDFSVERPDLISHRLIGLISKREFNHDKLKEFYRGRLNLDESVEALGIRDVFRRASECVNSWSDASGIFTTPLEHRIYGCILGMAYAGGHDAGSLAGKDNAGYFAVNFCGEPLCRVYQSEKDSESEDGSGRIDFFKRDGTGNRIKDSRGLPVLMDQFPFDGIADACRPDILKRVNDDCDNILKRKPGMPGE